MHDQLALLRQTRANLIRVTAELSDAQMTAVPDGFSNNILWNYGHCLVTQQRLCYGLSSLPMCVPDEWNDLLAKGSSPATWETAPDREEITRLLLSTADRMQDDLEAGRFEQFKTYPTSYGYELRSVSDALRFDVAHEALHLGVIMTLRHLV